MIFSKRKLLLPIMFVALILLSVGLVTSCSAGGTTEVTKTVYVTESSSLTSQEFQFINSVVTDSFFYTDTAAPTFVLYDKDLFAGDKVSLTYSEFTLAKIAVPDDTSALNIADTISQNTTGATFANQEVKQIRNGTEVLAAIPFSLTDFVAGVTDKAALDTLLDGVTEVYFKLVITEVKKTEEFDGAKPNEILSAYTNRTLSGSVKVERVKTGEAGNINIYNEYDLKAIDKDLAADYTLQKDIGISLTSAWTSLGDFTGTFDGNNKTIEIGTDGTSRVMNGLFSTIESAASDADIAAGNSVSVKDLTIDVISDVELSVSNDGLLAGIMKKGAIKNVTVKNSNSSKLNITGTGTDKNAKGGLIGLIGSDTTSTTGTTGKIVIDNVKSSVHISGTTEIDYVSGVVGWIINTSNNVDHTITLSNLEFTGKIENTNASADNYGGLIGNASPNLAADGITKLLTISGKVRSSTGATTEIKAGYKVGGALGTMKNAILNVEVGNIDVRATATTNTRVGGAVGFTEKAVVTAKVGSLGSVVVRGYQYVGGVAADVTNSSTINVEVGDIDVRATAPSNTRVGGVVGNIDASTVTAKVGSLGSVFISGFQYVGGVAGEVTNGSTITGHVDATGTTSGLVQIVSDFISTNGAAYVGGLAGKTENSTVQGYVKFRNATYDATNPIATAVPTTNDTNLTTLEKGGIIIKYDADQRQAVGGLVGEAAANSKIYGHADLRISAPYVSRLGGLVGRTDGTGINIAGYVSGTIYVTIPVAQENIGGLIGYRAAGAEVDGYVKDLVFDNRHITGKPAIALLLGFYAATPTTTDFRAFAINSKVLYEQTAATGTNPAVIGEKTDRVAFTMDATALGGIGAYVYKSTPTASNDGGKIKITGLNVNGSDAEVSFTYSGMTIGTSVGEWILAQPPILAGGTDIFGTQ